MTRVTVSIDNPEMVAEERFPIYEVLIDGPEGQRRVRFWAKTMRLARVRASMVRREPGEKVVEGPKVVG